MKKEDFILACLSCGDGKIFSPVHVQKLFFLMDRRLKDRVDGIPFYNFEPYAYGPFDKTVYDDLEGLAIEDYVDILLNKKWKEYRLTYQGQIKGKELFAIFEIPIQEYITKIVDFVLSLSFTDLVLAIYKAYPEMRANSVFQGA